MAHGSRRQIRLALVMNGGVSLAVWIGGITYEIDAIRRAGPDGSDDESTTALYRELLEILEQEVVVDVIAGASAGGINGVLLASAIFNGKALPNLRETWLGLGDFRTLLRSPSETNPASLMKGDDVILVELQRLLEDLVEADPPPLRDPLYLYVTATDLFGRPRQYHDTTGRKFDEFDSRRRLTFQSEHGGRVGPDYEWPYEGVMRPTVDFGDNDAVQLMAAAARSSSSFPVAFEAHRLWFVEEPPLRGHRRRFRDRNVNQPRPHWMIDGGVLDNQPFNPVLDRIAAIETPPLARRIVAYIVPYVNEPGTLDQPAPDYATARQTQAAAGTLPRDLPKLESLDRITDAQSAQEVAEADRKRLWNELASPDLSDAAHALFPAYRRTRYAASQRLWAAWASPDFRPGGGVLAQDPSVDPRQVVAAFGSIADDLSVVPAADLQSAPWIPDSHPWSQDATAWTWGLAPAERVAAWAELFLRDALERADDPRIADGIAEASCHTAALVKAVRNLKTSLYAAFKGASPNGPADARARQAFDSVDLGSVQQQFRELDWMLALVNGHSAAIAGFEVPRVAQLLDLEVIRNAFSIDDPRVPFPFDFLFMSAGIENSLGHEAHEPQTKLAGMKLHHFAGFLKRSWRANDWLWGRLDGVEHVLRALLSDRRYLAKCATHHPDLVDSLAAFAFPDDSWATALHSAWTARLEREAKWEEENHVAAADRAASICGEALPVAQFQALFNEALVDPDPESAARHMDCCRSALAARIQLQVLHEDIYRVAETAAEDLEQGANRSARGVYWSSQLYGRNGALGRTKPRALDPAEEAEIFRQLDIGEESPHEESDSRLAIGVASQGIAVAAAMLAGDRGGLPLPVRGALSSLRGITQALSGLGRLLAREPWVGAAAVAALTGIVVWAGISKNALLGAFFPALALMTVALAITLVTVATSLIAESQGGVKRTIGYILLGGIPLTFGLLAGWPGVTGVPGWFDRHLGNDVTKVVAGLALAAASATIARLALAYKAHADRLVTVATIGIAAVGSLLVAFGICAWLLPSATRWLRGEIGRDYAGAVATGAIAFGAAGVLRCFFRLVFLFKKGRRSLLTFYRATLFGALATAAGGFIAHRWVAASSHKGWTAVAAERKGTIMVVILLGVLLFAAVVAEITFPPLRIVLNRAGARARVRQGQVTRAVESGLRRTGVLNSDSAG